MPDDTMKDFEPYVQRLEELVRQVTVCPWATADQANVTEALNGGPSSTFRELVNLNTRRTAGAFFTATGLRERAVCEMSDVPIRAISILDPACGIGDLLLAAARHLSVGPDVETTLKQWGNQLSGIDLYPEFVRATKARLVLAAFERCQPVNRVEIPVLEKVFRNIKIGNALEASGEVSSASYIVINPPFAMMKTPDGCRWSSGDVSMAAVFMEHCLQNAANQTSIVAILPDVLRSGSRYTKWRTRIEELARLDRIELVGQFDTWTDIDVFILRATVDRNSRRDKSVWWESDDAHMQRIQDLFEVSVGPVVPHRDPEEGEYRRYIYARLLTGRGDFDTDYAKQKRYSGRVFKPPFVVVRRTTRPDRLDRVVGTVITGNDPVAVENHLIILKPRDNSLSSCRRLLDFFGDKRTIEWLNRRIRCRHFTVGALKELPWWKDDNE